MLLLLNFILKFIFSYLQLLLISMKWNINIWKIEVKRRAEIKSKWGLVSERDSDESQRTRITSKLFNYSLVNKTNTIKMASIYLFTCRLKFSSLILSYPIQSFNRCAVQPCFLRLHLSLYKTILHYSYFSNMTSTGKLINSFSDFIHIYQLHINLILFSIQCTPHLQLHLFLLLVILPIKIIQITLKMLQGKQNPRVMDSGKDGNYNHSSLFLYHIKFNLSLT